MKEKQTLGVKTPVFEGTFIAGDKSPAYRSERPRKCGDESKGCRLRSTDDADLDRLLKFGESGCE